MSDVPHELIGFFVFAFGSIVGSFLNVVIFRVPLQRSIVRPGSACPACAAPVRSFDNIPIVSWLLLRARCRDCAAPISVRYPLVEAAAGACALFVYLRWGFTLTGWEVLIFCWVCIVLALIDYDHQILPDVITYPTILFGFAMSFSGGLTWWLDSVLGAAIGAALPTAVIVIYKVIRGEEGMGWGDVKYLAAIGAVVGVQSCLWILVCAAIVGALVGVALIAMGRGSSKTPLPFGTFLAIAVLVWLYAPTAWIGWTALLLSP